MASRGGHVVVVGGGNAGVEAAVAASRVGTDVTLLTLNEARVGELSCNPAIGGVAKGTLVREIAALGGVMPRSADGAELQFRMLNVSKGPAVWGPRKQEDLEGYMRLQREELRRAGVRVIETEAVGLTGGPDRIGGVRTSVGTLEADSVVIAAGTFLGGRLFRGRERWSGGRSGDRAANALQTDLKSRMFHVKRFKTGTPARLLSRSLDRDRMRRQGEDGRGYRFATGPEGPGAPKTRGQCWITHTTGETSRAAERGMASSPLFKGCIEGRGPRYCPSFEDKVRRFPERNRHRVFIEPMGGGGRLAYPSGLSTSLSRETQMAMLRTVPGLEEAEVARFGYAVEYGWLDRGEFDRTLRARGVENLFFAGQVCGTSGYEEAAALGLLAGANAARAALEEQPREPDRMESYLGVMVDDLVARGTEEPYRLFSSRSENRLHLRQDNAPARMEGLARKLFGRVPDWQSRWCAALEQVRRLLDEPGWGGKSLAELARRPEVGVSDIMGLCSRLKAFPVDVVETAVLDEKYSGYIRRAHARREHLKRMERVSLDSVADYMDIELISIEARQALNRHRPRTLGEAAALSSVRHSDLEGLMIHLFGGRST